MVHTTESASDWNSVHHQHIPDPFLSQTIFKDIVHGVKIFAKNYWDPNPKSSSVYKRATIFPTLYLLQLFSSPSFRQVRITIQIQGTFFERFV